MTLMQRTTLRLLSVAAAVTLTGPAGAHSGHGLGDGSH